MSVKMIPVDSKNIDSVGYDEDSDALYVRFKSTGLYIYENVAEEKFHALRNAESPTAYLTKHIKPSHKFKKG